MKPDVLRARRNYKAKLFGGGKRPYCRVTISELASLGVGIDLHFRILQYLIAVFLLMSLAVLPIMIFAYVGKVRARHTAGRRGDAASRAPQSSPLPPPRRPSATTRWTC